MSDPDSSVRESSAEALGTAAKAQGERNMTPLLLGLEPLKMTKIDEYKAKVEVKKFAAAPVAAAPSTSAGTSKPRPVARGAAKPKQVAKVPAPGTASNESLEDFGLGPAPSKPSTAADSFKKPAIAKPGQVKSRLGLDSKRSTSATTLAGDSAPSKYSTVKKGTVSRLAVSAKTTASGVSKKSDSEATSANSAMMSDNLKHKEQRIADERAMKVLKWSFSSPREEFYLQLKDQMIAAEWDGTLVTYLFHSDFKYHIKSIDMIRNSFEKQTDASPFVIANIDLILKWIGLRFFDTNPSVILKELELLMQVFRICESAGYTLSELEGNSFLPYLVLKTGDPKDTVRNKVHEILMLMRNIFPPTKLFSHLFTGLQSKNSRQRATCLEEIALLIELKGMSLFQTPNLSVKEIARFIAERDNGVRNGALSCIVQIYFIEGEKVLKLVGNLSDKDMSLIEERIKRASKNRPATSGEL